MLLRILRQKMLQTDRRTSKGKTANFLSFGGGGGFKHAVFGFYVTLNKFHLNGMSLDTGEGLWNKFYTQHRDTGFFKTESPFEKRGLGLVLSWKACNFHFSANRFEPVETVTFIMERFLTIKE